MIINLAGSSLTLAEALDKANDSDTILLDNKTYNEKLTISKKNLTLKGMPDTVICFDACHGAINPSTGNKYGTTGSATVRVLECAENFNAYNITFKNSYVRNHLPNGQAVAFKAECNCLLENCKFISRQDTLYLDYGKDIKVNSCYIEGDIDFIFGSSNALFTNCVINCITEEANECYATAPNTLKSNQFGFIFDNCCFKASTDVKCYLGRPWYPGSFKEEPYPKLTIKNSSFEENYIFELKTMHENDPERHTLTLDNVNIL